MKQQKLKQMTKLDRLLHIQSQLIKNQAKKDQQENEIDKTLKIVQDKIKNVERKQSEKKKNILIRNQKIKKGEFKVKKLYSQREQLPNESRPDIILPDQLPEKFAHASTDLASHLRRQYQRVFLKGLIEYKSGEKIQKTHQVKFKSRSKPKRNHDNTEIKFN